MEWTKEDDLIIIEEYPTCSSRTIARRHGWQERATERRVSALIKKGLLQKKWHGTDWSEAELEQFRQYWAAGFSVEYIATRMDKGISACYYVVKKQRKAGAIAKRPTRRATQAERKMAIDLYKAGEKVSRISAQTGLLVSVISRILTDAGLVGDPHEPRMMMCGYCVKFGGVRFDPVEGIVGTCAETGEARQRCDECKCGKPDYKEGYWCLFKGKLIRAVTNR